MKWDNAQFTPVVVQRKRQATRQEAKNEFYFRSDTSNPPIIFKSVYFFFIPSSSSPHFSSSLPLVQSDQKGSHSKHFSSPPPPTTVRAFQFYRTKSSAFSSHVDSRRIEHTHIATVRRRYLLLIVNYCAFFWAGAGFELTQSILVVTRLNHCLRGYILIVIRT